MRHAVLFTTYAWDDFVVRQYDRIAKRVHEGDLYIIADETNGALASLPKERVIRTSQTEILTHGGRTAFVEKGDWEAKPALWWNLDFLTYRFFDDHQEYDYCVTMDYDACINLDVDKLVKAVAAAGYDFVALPVPEKMSEWRWQPPHAKIYSLDEIQAHLLCVIVISRDAANYLARRRREMAKEYVAGTVKFWPFCEAFMATELHRGGFRIGNLADFGNVDHLSWQRVCNENDIVKSMPEGFIHPVLDEQRYLRAYMQRYQPMRDIFFINSPLWKRLRQFPFKSYAPFIWPVVKFRLSCRLERYIRRIMPQAISD